MFFYPYAAPISAPVIWAGNQLATLLMAGGLLAAFVPTIVALRCRRTRRKHAASIWIAIPDQRPRAAA